MGRFSLTLRDTTDRPGTMTMGTNKLTRTDPAALVPTLDHRFADDGKSDAIPELWDGKTSPRIEEGIEGLLDYRAARA